jgi:hypothetical protein
VKIQDSATRRLLESVLPILTANRKVAVYGPCNLTQLASTHPGSPPTLNN